MNKEEVIENLRFWLWYFGGWVIMKDPFKN